MALTEIGPRWARPRRTYFGRRGRWGALARVSPKQQNWAQRRPTKTQPRSNAPWAGGPANKNKKGIFNDFSKQKSFF